ncbi:Uncharacterised protein [Mycobacteroides abscessus subsp. abscessus]|nr:Uncharacterised protein [Mycobacteroides abscessus subsp. abscessus]
MTGTAASCGSACSACGDWVASGGVFTELSSRVRKLENSEPNMAAPKELPMVRKNVTPDVATPKSSKRAVFCTMRVSTCMDAPMPTPRMNRYSDCRTNGVESSILDSSTSAMAMMAVPATG